MQLFHYFIIIFIILPFYFILYYFQGHIFYSLQGFMALDRHFTNGIIFTKSDWLPWGGRDSVAFGRIFTHLKPSSGSVVLINTHHDA